MIQLYAIINEEQTVECYVHEQQQRKSMESLLSHIMKKIKSSSSKTVQSLLISSYQVYYFNQATFTFILATKTNNRQQRMKNYLRVVADIFYENYDEKKFKHVLRRIMEQINRTEFGTKKNQISMIEDEESFLVMNSSNFQEQKKNINRMINKRRQQSKLAYIVSTILFVFIVVLCIMYLNKKWN